MLAGPRPAALIDGLVTPTCRGKASIASIPETARYAVSMDIRRRLPALLPLLFACVVLAAADPGPSASASAAGIDLDGWSGTMAASTKGASAGTITISFGKGNTIRCSEFSRMGLNDLPCTVNVRLGSSYRTWSVGVNQVDQEKGKDVTLALTLGTRSTPKDSPPTKLPVTGSISTIQGDMVRTIQLSGTIVPKGAAQVPPPQAPKAEPKKR